VLASPFGVALLAATVAAGKTPVPRLIEDRSTTVTGEASPITPRVLDGLRPMMRQVVTTGTARGLGDCCGSVFGKTGEAEFDGGSHSWFAGYRGDLAFASLIVGGGSSVYAVRMTKVMFESLPGDFLS
jgi:cell division protein FtsI/penicillin-binding protein 2